MRASTSLPLLLPLLLVVTPFPKGHSTPAALVDHFYRIDMQSFSGLPSEQDLVRLKPLLSSRLHAQFLDTLDYETQWIARHPDEPSTTGGPPTIYKPPFADSGYFVGSPDGSGQFVVSRTVRDQDARWFVFLQSLPQPGMSPWRVAVVVILEDHRYVIDDVLYEPADDGSARGSLSHYLSYREED